MRHPACAPHPAPLALPEGSAPLMELELWGWLGWAPASELSPALLAGWLPRAELPFPGPAGPGAWPSSNKDWVRRARQATCFLGACAWLSHGGKILSHVSDRASWTARLGNGVDGAEK